MVFLFDVEIFPVRGIDAVHRCRTLQSDGERGLRDPIVAHAGYGDDHVGHAPRRAVGGEQAACLVHGSQGQG